ncbi:MAG: hypothetical protein AAGH78_01570 [Cyanobacteria bacterium P01_H01_bin.58]
MSAFKSWAASLIIFSLTVIGVNCFTLHNQAAAAINTTGHFEQVLAYGPTDLNIEARYLTPQRIISQGFDVALDADAIVPAFEYWTGFMPSEMTEVFYAFDMSSSIEAAAESIGELDSYELLGTVSVENLETKLRSQLVFSKLVGGRLTYYARFILLNTLEGWRIIDIDFRNQRSQVIDGFISLILESEDTQKLIERVLSYSGSNY